MGTAVLVRRTASRRLAVSRRPNPAWVLDDLWLWDLHHARTPIQQLAQPFRRLILRRDRYTCRACGSRERLSIDHILPRCRGGTHHSLNLQVLCESCNHRKGPLLPDVWALVAIERQAKVRRINRRQQRRQEHRVAYQLVERALQEREVR